MHRIGILSTHPIQYYSPWYRALAKEVDLEVWYAHRQSSADQGRSAFGVDFEWDIPLLDGYRSQFLHNRARRPDVSTFAGCDTPEIAAIIRERRYHAFIVHGWYTFSFWQAMLACWQSGTPLMVRGDSQLLTPRSQVKRLFKAIAYRAFIPRFNAYLVVGKRARQYYLHYGAKAQRMFFAPHAVDNQFFRSQHILFRAQRTSLRTQWNIPSDAVVFLFVGKLTVKKRPFDFLEALHLVAQQYPTVRGLIVGDGPLRDLLETRVCEHNIPATFTGFLNQSQIAQAYAASDILVLPSDGRETWGLVVNEAMASGLPAIVSDVVGCAPDLVLQGRTGLVYTCGQVEQLVEAMEYFVVHPFHTEAKRVAIQRHIERYSILAAVNGTLAALKYVL